MAPRFGLGRKLGLLAVLGLTIAGIVGVQMRMAPALAARRDSALRYIPKPEVMRLASFGYRSVSADLLWIRALQNLSVEFESPDEKYEWTESLFRGITDLDPLFLSAYRLGATWLTLTKRDGAAAIGLLEKGIEANPDSWELPHDLGMIHYLDRRDRDASLAALKTAVDKPDCPLHVREFVAFLMVERDEAWGAIAMWLHYSQQHDNAIVKDVAWESICMIQCRMLRRGVESYREKTGRNPGSLPQLLESGIVPLREGFDLLEGVAYDAETGRIWSTKLEELQTRKHLAILETAVKVYREYKGVPPGRVEDLLEVIHEIPRHPDHEQGTHYALDPETLEIGIRTTAVEPQR